MKTKILFIILIACWTAACKKESSKEDYSPTHECRNISSMSEINGPNYAFELCDDKVSWVILIEDGYAYATGAQGLAHGGDGDAILRGSDGRDELKVVIERVGQMIFVSKTGDVKEVSQAFKFGEDIFDVYSGHFDLERYPFLRGVNEVFEKDKLIHQKQTEQAAASDR